MFDHDLIENHPIENIPLNRDVFLMDEKWMPAYEEALLTLLRGGEYKSVGYISYAAVRSISQDAIELSWYPNIYDRFHEVRVSLPRSQFVLCTECRSCDEKAHIFVRGEWLTNLHVRAYSVFVYIDAIGVKAALSAGKLTRPKLVALRDRIDAIAARHPELSFVTFADSLLLKSNWFVGQWDSAIRYTYEPESIIALLPEIKAAYVDILGLPVYAVIAQGSNEFYDDGLLHISNTRNHVSLNSLGLPFAQILAIDNAVRHAIRSRAHAPADVYMDEKFFRSLRLDYAYDKESALRYAYRSPMAEDQQNYVLGAFSDLVAKLLSPGKSE